MTNQSNLPLFRVKFCPKTGTTDDGNDELGNAVEIGTVWRRKDATKGAIMKLDIVPENIRDGVILLQTPKPKGGA